MRFVHLADMHFDSPFTTLSDKGNLGEKRRIEQRNIFKKAKEKAIPKTVVNVQWFSNVTRKNMKSSRHRLTHFLCNFGCTKGKRKGRFNHYAVCPVYSFCQNLLGRDSHMKALFSNYFLKKGNNHFFYRIIWIFTIYSTGDDSNWTIHLAKFSCKALRWDVHPIAFIVKIINHNQYFHKRSYL